LEFLVIAHIFVSAGWNLIPVAGGQVQTMYHQALPGLAKPTIGRRYVSTARE